MTDSIFISIFKIQSKRIGYIRTVVGAFLMYVTLPLFIFIHVTLLIFFYKSFIVPFIKVENYKISNYIILDRYNISNLHWFDRINCLFCEYANGIILLLNDEIDQIASNEVPNVFVGILQMIALTPITIFFILGMLFTTIPTNILMVLLGLHRGSHRRINRELLKLEYAKNHHVVVTKIIYVYKISARVISYNLEQIESAWCPIKHLERNGYVLPEHHKNFIHRTDLPTLKKTLEEKGTVSDNKPRF